MPTQYKDRLPRELIVLRGYVEGKVNAMRDAIQHLEGDCVDGTITAGRPIFVVPGRRSIKLGPHEISYNDLANWLREVNRLAGERLDVVDSIPGTIRDRLVAEAEWTGVVFDVVDTGGIDPTTVKKGPGREPLSIGSADFIPQIRAQAEIAIQDADAVLFITDVESGVTPADREVAEMLRRRQSSQAS